MLSERKGEKMEKNKAKILVIDDDPDFTEAVRLILQSAPYDVVTASNPEEGLGMIISENPDLILLDIMMDSVFDGYSLCHALRTSEEFKAQRNTPVIHVSSVQDEAKSNLQSLSRGFGLVGPDDFIQKPVDPEDLFACIKKHINGQVETR